MRVKRASLLTKLVILALLIYLATSLLDLQGRIRETQAERDALLSGAKKLNRYFKAVEAQLSEKERRP